MREGGERTDSWELGAAVTALWRAALLLGVLILEFSAGGFDDADFVRASVVPSRTSSVIMSQGGFGHGKPCFP